jgi:hypothetical protein
MKHFRFYVAQLLLVMCAQLLLTGCPPDQQQELLKLNKPRTGADSQKQVAKEEKNPPPTVVLENLPPALSAQTEIKISVSGKNLTGYSYEISQKESCKDFSGTEIIPLSQPIEKTVEAGKHLLCVTGIDNNKQRTETFSFAWEVDLTQPTVTISAQTAKKNLAPEFEAKVEGQNAQKYKYKIVLGGLESDDCGDENYSKVMNIEEPIVHRMTSDGRFTVCLVGISRADVEQAFPSIFTFEQDAMLPEVKLSLESGADLPSILNANPLKLKVSGINRAQKFSYKLLAGNANCYSLKDEDFSSPMALANGGEGVIEFTEVQLKEGIISPSTRILRTLCVASFKTGADNKTSRFVNVSRFYVDISGLAINEGSVTGIPANPTTKSSFDVKVVPIGGNSSTTTFDKSTSKIYHKLERFDTREQAESSCSFDGVTAISYTEKLAVTGRSEKGFHRLCLMLENLAKTKSNALSVVWFKDNIVASIPISNSDKLEPPLLAGQKATAASLNKKVTPELFEAAPAGSTVSYKFKHYKGTSLCNNNADAYVPIQSDQIAIPKLDPEGSTHTLCVLATQKSSAGAVLAEQSQASRFTWFRDGINPDHTVTGLPFGTSNDTKYTIKITAAKEGMAYSSQTDAVKIAYTEKILDRAAGASCPRKGSTVEGKPVYTEKPLAAATGTLTLSLERSLTSSNNGLGLMFCSFSRDNSGNETVLPKMNAWTFDTRPIATVTFDSAFKQGAPSNKKTFDISIFSNPDHKGYKSKLVSGNNCGTDATGYPSTPNHLVSNAASLIKSFAISGADGPRTLCVLAIGKDNAQQPFTEPTSFTWILDTAAPKVQLQTNPPATLAGAKVTQTLSVRSSDAKDPAAEYDYQLSGSSDCPAANYKPKVKLTTPLVLTSNVSAGKTGSFRLCVRGYDLAGNVSEPTVITWKQTAPQ